MNIELLPDQILYQAMYSFVQGIQEEIPTDKVKPETVLPQQIDSKVDDVDLVSIKENITTQLTSANKQRSTLIHESVCVGTKVGVGALAFAETIHAISTRQNFIHTLAEFEALGATAILSIRPTEALIRAIVDPIAERKQKKDIKKFLKSEGIL